MEVRNINDYSSFNGWRSNAKPAIIQMVKKMSKAKADKTIALVNNLEATSPHHNLNANGLGFWIVPKDKFTKTKDFDLFIDPKGVFWRTPEICLEKMQEHINKENPLIQKAGKTVETLIPELKKKFGGQYGIFSTGLKLDHKERKLIATNLAKLSICENGSKKVEEALKMLDIINEKAVKTNLRIFPTRIGDKMIIRGQNLRGGYSNKDIKFSDDFNKTLKKVEKFLDKENIKNQRYKIKSDIRDAKEDLADAKRELKFKKREIRNQQIKALKEKLSNSFIGKIIKKIFDKIEQKSQEKEAKIAKELKF